MEGGNKTKCWKHGVETASSDGFIFLISIPNGCLFNLAVLIWVDGWRVVDDDDYNQSVGNPKQKV
jgi:hypothetical protein